MLNRHTLAAVLVLLALGPTPAAAQRGLRETVTSPSTSEELAVAFGLYVIVTLAVGAIILTVDRSYVRRTDAQLAADPVSAGAIGLGILVGGFVALNVTGAIATLLVDAGAPVVLENAPLLLGLVASVALTVVNTIGMIVAGLVLLRRLRDDTDPNPWLALVVGAVAVQVLYLVPLVNLLVAICVVALATGGIVTQWWQRRTATPSESTTSQQTTDH